LRRYEQILVEIVLFEMGVCHFERKFQGKGRVVCDHYYRQDACSTYAVLTFDVFLPHRGDVLHR